MEEDRRNSLSGMEIPVASGGNIVKWIEIHVPSPSATTNSSGNNECVMLPSSEDYASSSNTLIQKPPISFIWRINKTSPNALELLKLSPNSGFPITGLRFVFAHNLSPFAFVFTNEGCDNGNLVYFLYTLTSSGVVYVLQLSNTLTYKSGSIFPLSHLIHFDVRTYLNESRVTSVAASPGFLYLGRSDGCISCFQPVMYLQNSSDFHQELRDDSGFHHLWGREKVVAAVRDLCVSEVHGKDLICVLHADGKLRVWNYSLDCGLVLCQNMADLGGFMCMRLWLGKANYDSGIIPLAVLYGKSLDVSMDVITVYGLHFGEVVRMSPLSLDSEVQNIPLETGKLRDVRFTSDKIWTLKADKLTSHMLWHKSSTMESQSYTLLDHNKHWTDSEFQSSSLDGLKSEIVLLVEHETSISVFHWWTCYRHHWCNNNEPCTLLVLSDIICLDDKNNTVSLFFRLEDAEHSFEGSSSEHINLMTSLGLGVSHNELKILAEVPNPNLHSESQFKPDKNKKFMSTKLISISIAGFLLFLATGSVIVFLFSPATGSASFFSVVGHFILVVLRTLVIVLIGLVLGRLMFTMAMKIEKKEELKMLNERSERRKKAVADFAR